MCKIIFPVVHEPFFHVKVFRCLILIFQIQQYLPIEIRCELGFTIFFNDFMGEMLD